MKKKLLTIFRVLLILIGIVTIIIAFVKSTRVYDIKHSYKENLGVVINFTHTPTQGYLTHYKYIYAGEEYDKELYQQEAPTIGQTESIWVNPKDPNDFIFNKVLEKQDTGNKFLKVSVLCIVIFILSFSFNKDKQIEKPKDKDDITIEDILQEIEQSKDTDEQ